MKEERIQSSVFQTIEMIFAAKIESVQPIFRGRKNLKWIVHLSNKESLFVKQYYPKRYIGKWPHVKKALVIQDKLYQKGVACPKIYSRQGEYILSTSNGVLFSIMEVCAGEVVQPGQINEVQMNLLGYELGKMHTTLRAVPATKLHWSPSKAFIQEQWEQNYKLAKAQKSSDRVLASLESQHDILHRLDFSQFNLSPQGWTHWDMYVDNVLFDGDRVSAILDFDRMRYVYPELDVARAILSGCIDEKGVNACKLVAFMRGYQEWFPLFQASDLNRSLQLLWTVESPWWCIADIEEKDENPRRFFIEIEWVQKNWGSVSDYLHGKLN